MSIHNLDALFDPRAVAVIGASNHPGSVGAILARNLTQSGFQGPVMAVNPHEAAIGSSLSYRNIAALPVPPDLAVIATPPDQVATAIAELGERGCRAAVVITAGFGEGEKTLGQQRRRDALAAARPYGVRLVGPNCLGVIAPAKGLNASFAHLSPSSGDIAFVGQSGAMITTILDWAAGRRIGFSRIVSLGDMADVDFGDMLDYLALDPATRAILLYVEAITSARKFMSAARIAARAKPVIVLKAGRSPEGAKAAVSHTGALAGADLVYDAAFRQAGLLRVDHLRDLLDAAETLTSHPRLRGDRLTIVTNGGGAGVLATDALAQSGGRLAPLTEQAHAALDEILPKAWSGANPVDILGDADGDRYAKTLDVLISKGDQDALLVMNCPTGLVDSSRVARQVAKSACGPAAPPMFSVWLGEATAAGGRSILSDAGAPTYETPEDAVRAFAHLVGHRRNQALLQETPAGHLSIDDVARAQVREILKSCEPSDQVVLGAPEAKAILQAYGVPTVRAAVADTVEAAVSQARALGFPVALKIVSPDITHKSDVGGVRLDLRDPEAVEAAALGMKDEVARRAPQARITGFSIEQMINPPGSLELLAGISQDATFGPVVLFGQGGIATERVADRAMALAPFGGPIARDLISRTRISKLMSGYRHVPPVAAGAVEDVLCRLSTLASDFPQILELDINPLLAHPGGVVALDARIVVGPKDALTGARPALAPYPASMAHDLVLEGLPGLSIRPIRPDDEAALIGLVDRCDLQDLRFRFWGAIKTLNHDMAARFCQIDYDREMALVAVRHDKSAVPEILAVARLFSDPDLGHGEYALLVRSDLKTFGLGRALMTELLDYARSRGLASVSAEEVSDNAAFLKLASALGAHETVAPDEPGGIKVVFDLGEAGVKA